MYKPEDERRGSPRVPVRVPVAVRTPSSASELTAHTKDLSANGIFLYLDSAVEPGSLLEMVLILPPEVTGGERRWAACEASVVRVEGSSGNGFGLAARINRMDLLPEIVG